MLQQTGTTRPKDHLNHIFSIPKLTINRLFALQKKINLQIKNKNSKFGNLSLIFNNPVLLCTKMFVKIEQMSKFLIKLIQ